MDFMQIHISANRNRKEKNLHNLQNYKNEFTKVKRNLFYIVVNLYMFKLKKNMHNITLSLLLTVQY